ncbi:MAG: hypothetical protein P8175_08080 [Deltaproteobacteria bacterium]|jgi:hypothetical protein
MDRQKLRKLSRDKNLISGIYNYCDRWCERCPFTSRCMNFAMSEEEFSDPETRDIRNEAFWRKFAETLHATLEFVKETARESGIDLDAVDVDDEAEERRIEEELAESHEVCRFARAYGTMVDDWFKAARDLFEEQPEDPSGMDPATSIVQPETGEDRDTLQDALEVVRWYQHFIYVKLMRAVRGELEDGDEMVEEFPKDSDGSAKVALIATDRSIAAWGRIRNYFPFRSQDIVKMLVHLEGLRNKVENAFPNARAFVRPGFDKIDLNS